MYKYSLNPKIFTNLEAIAAAITVGLAELVFSRVGLSTLSQQKLKATL